MNSELSFQCPHFSVCPGCEKNPLFLSQYPLYERAKDFFLTLSHSQVSPQFITSKQLLFWRTRAKLACRSYKGRGRFGLFQYNSHDLIPIPNCQMHHPSINLAVKSFEEIEKDFSYDEKRHQGLIRYLQCSVERSSQKVQIGLIVNSKSKRDVSLFEKIVKSNPEVFHSLWVNYNPYTTNRIHGSVWEHLYGPKLYMGKYLWNTNSLASISFYAGKP